VEYGLEPFDPSHAATVASWAPTPWERDAWASTIEDEPDVSVFARWHADDGVHPFVLVQGDRVVGYGEVWEDPEETEAELARLIVDPRMRGRGVGRRMVELLSERARALGYDDVWVRVVPSNEPAIKAYAAAGFVRTTAENESRFNEGQPREYVWMRLGG
jgi:ribosomal protein S18 acetylase RimI-like enzyme